MSWRMWRKQLGWPLGFARAWAGVSRETGAGLVLELQLEAANGAEITGAWIAGLVGCWTDGLRPGIALLGWWQLESAVEAMLG